MGADDMTRGWRRTQPLQGMCADVDAGWCFRLACSWMQMRAGGTTEQLLTMLRDYDMRGWLPLVLLWG